MSTTTKQTHTPGQWIVEQGAFVYALSQHNINRFSLQVQGGYTDSGTRTSKEELDANARLIAAAPELLQALKEAKKLLETAQRYFPKSIKNRDTFHLVNILANSVDPALATAEGVQP